MQEDLSGPYDNWAAARHESERAARRKVARTIALMLIAVAGAAGVLAVWLVLLDEIHPLWNRPPGWAPLVLFVPPLFGMLLLRFSSSHTRGRDRLAMTGLLLMLPLMAFPLAPLLLYANQAWGASSTSCSAYRVDRKEVVKGRGRAYDVVLSGATGPATTLRVSERQFRSLTEGQAVWVEASDGLFGIRYVRQITPYQIACTASQTAS